MISNSSARGLGSTGRVNGVGLVCRLDWALCCFKSRDRVLGTPHRLHSAGIELGGPMMPPLSPCMQGSGPVLPYTPNLACRTNPAGLPTDPWGDLQAG